MVNQKNSQEAHDNKTIANAKTTIKEVRIDTYGFMYVEYMDGHTVSLYKMPQKNEVSSVVFVSLEERARRLSDKEKEELGISKEVA